MIKHEVAQREPTLSGKSQTKLRGVKVVKYKVIMEKLITESIHARMQNQRRQSGRTAEVWVQHRKTHNG